MKKQHCIYNIAVIYFCILLAGCGISDVSNEIQPEEKSAFAMAEKTAQAVVKALGNGAPSGSHFNLNIIGVPKGKTAEITNGNRIFVSLSGKTNILLSEGDFQVLDANGTDGSASFQLPNPDADNDGITTYSVFARALGKPGGSSKLTTCATDPVLGQVVCSVSSLISVRNKGKSMFSNVSRELLFVHADLNGDGVVERTPIFNDALQNFFWEYDNNGLKLLQLRFYEVPTTVE